MKQCKHDIARGYACIDPECPKCGRDRKVARVLDAARAWRNGFVSGTNAIECNLVNAIDAFDAPRERYYTAWCAVWARRCGSEPDMPLATANNPDIAAKISAALNAQEAKNGAA